MYKYSKVKKSIARRGLEAITKEEFRIGKAAQLAGARHALPLYGTT
jgi:hypothetical protein